MLRSSAGSPPHRNRLIDEAMTFGEASDTMQRPNVDANPQVPMAWPAVLPGANGPQGAGAWGLEGQTNIHRGEILQQGVNVYVCWVRENYDFERQSTDATLIDTERVVTDSWRVVVYSGRTVLLDELAENLWEESRHPYVRIVDVEMGDFWPTPITSHLASNQIAINRLLSSLQGNAELVGNPIFLDVADSGLNRGQIMNRPGTRLTMNKSAANAQAQKPDWLRPPDMPPGVANLVQFHIGRMENISGLSGPNKGHSPRVAKVKQQRKQPKRPGSSASVRASVTWKPLWENCSNFAPISSSRTAMSLGWSLSLVKTALTPHSDSLLATSTCRPPIP